MVAQQLGLGFVTAVDPTQGGQQNVIVGNFLAVLAVTMIFATDMHHLVIAALNDSYRLFRPGDVPIPGDIADLVTRTVASAFRIGIQLSAPFLVFGLLFNLGLGILSRLMPQMQVYFVAAPLSILLGFMKRDLRKSKDAYAAFRAWTSNTTEQERIVRTIARIKAEIQAYMSEQKEVYVQLVHDLMRVYGEEFDMTRGISFAIIWTGVALFLVDLWLAHWPAYEVPMEPE